MRNIDLGQFNRTGVQQALNAIVREIRIVIAAVEASISAVEVSSATIAGTITNPSSNTYILPDGTEQVSAGPAVLPAQGVIATRDGNVSRLHVVVDVAPPTTPIVVNLWRFPSGGAPGVIILMATILATQRTASNLSSVAVSRGDLFVISHNNTDAQPGNLSASWEMPL